MTNVERHLWLMAQPWFRGISGGKGEVQTVVETKIEPKTPDELKLIAKQVELAEIEVEAVKRQNDILASIFPGQKALLEAQVRVGTETLAGQRELLAQIKTAATETDIQREIRETAEKRTLAYLRGEAPALAEADKKRIQEAYDAASAEGGRQIQQFAEETAAQRGMRLTDSPIGAQVLPEVRRLQENLAGAKAQAELNVGTTSLQFGEAIRSFQEGLRQAAFQNRLALVGRPSSTPLVGGSTGAGAAMANLSPLLDILSRERIAGATKTETKSGGGPDLAGIGGILGGAGSAATGAAALFALSSAKYKRDILPLDRDEYDRALARVRETPITRYRYKWEPDRGPKHIGPILELAPPEITDDGETVNLLDYAGLQHAALKAVDRKVETLTKTLVELVKGRDGKYAYAG